MNTFQTRGEVAIPPMPQLIIAADGSHKGRIHSGGFLATNGRFGIQTFNYGKYDIDPHNGECSNAAELSAILYSMGGMSHKTDITILSDSKYALRYIEKWKNGEDDMPNWCKTNPSLPHDKRLVNNMHHLRTRIAKTSEHITTQHVRGHTGDLLNEAADSLAKIGRNVIESVYNKEEARRRAMGLVSGFLQAYAEQA